MVEEELFCELGVSMWWGNRREQRLDDGPDVVSNFSFDNGDKGDDITYESLNLRKSPCVWLAVPNSCPLLCLILVDFGKFNALHGSQ